MVKLSEFRRRGMIVARQHDAFLLALLLAVLINAAFFAVQALLPKLVLLITFFGINPPPPLPDAEKQIPFVLVDPALFDEEVRTDLPADAEGTAGREARQTVEMPDLPEETAYREEGIDMILTAPEGNPGPAAPQGNAESDPDQPAPPERQEPPEPAEPPPEPLSAPEPTPEPEPLPEPDVPEIAAAPPEAERFEAPPEEAPTRPESTRDEDEPEAPPRPVNPLDDVIDLAALAATPEGFIDPSTRELERVMNQAAERPRPPLRERPRTERPEPPQSEPPTRPHAPAEQREAPQPRPDRPQPVFKKIGGESSSGGAPPRRSTRTAVRLIGEDASMRILQHRWAAYMAKVARQLQESLNRQMVLAPTIFSAGQVKIRFGIAPDGALSHFETIYVQDGMEAERIMSERMLQEAAPFDPLTPEMQKDVNFQKMTVVVTLM